MIPRRTLRDEVSTRLRERLVRGQLPPGERINESTLSRELGVSRTPLREALLQMEKEGLVASEPAKGMVARPLTTREVREVYPMLGTLEGLALRSCGEQWEAALAELSALLGELADARTADAARELDNRWHGLLLAQCPNERLLEMIGMLRRITQRYWLVLLAVEWPFGDSVAQHQAVLDDLAQGDLQAASLRLEAHWAAGMGTLLDRLAALGNE